MQMLKNSNNIFVPDYSTGKRITAQSDKTLSLTEINIKKNSQCILTNLGAVPIYIKFINNTVTPTNESIDNEKAMLIPEGKLPIIVSVPPTTKAILAITESSTAVLHMIFGLGK